MSINVITLEKQISSVRGEPQVMERDPLHQTQKQEKAIVSIKKTMNWMRVAIISMEIMKRNETKNRKQREILQLFFSSCELFFFKLVANLLSVT